MSRCLRGPVVFWLLTMLFTGASFCTCHVCAQQHDSNGLGLGAAADWRDWLLEEAARPAQSDSEAGPLVRRITPKSVFVAPSFSGCSEGYRQDGMGRCVKLVKVNQAAQLDFLLQKLNSKFAPTADKNSEKKKDESGPFHVDIPLGFTSQNTSVPKADAQNISAENPGKHDNAVSKTESPTTTERTTTETSETTTTDVPMSSTNVERLPDSSPFVIVVANDTGNYFTGSFNTGTDVVYVQESTVDASLPSTTELSITTEGDQIGLLSDQDDVSGTTTSTDIFGEDESTSSPFVDTTTETVGEYLSTATPLEPASTEAEDMSPVTVTSSDEEQTEETTKGSINKEVFVNEETADDSVFGLRQVVGTTVGCETAPYKEEDDIYGRIVGSNPVRRCRPVDVPTTVRYPSWTGTPRPPTPYYVRFPSDDVIAQQPPYRQGPYDDRHKNGYVRFPERITGASSHRHPTHTSDGAPSSSTASGSWYPSPPSWFPFFQAHKNWMNRYDTRLQYDSSDPDRPHPVSSVFRKQYHDYRPPAWIDKRMPWPHRH